MVDTKNSQLRPAHSEIITERKAISAARVWNFLFTLFVIGLLTTGWMGRDNTYLSAAEGTGYALGIIGGAAMLLLMGYPLRKSLRSMQNWGPIKYWFQIHMILGVLGPVMVLYHANFGLGSANSNLAMFSMLTVACSGLIGRHFYKKIHFGLYGHKVTLKNLREDFQLTKGNLGAHISLSPKIIKMIQGYEKMMIKKRIFLFHIVSLPFLFFKTKLMSLRIKRALINDLKKQARANNWGKEMLHDFIGQAKMYLGDYFLCLRKISQLSLYHRLFSVWHILHMPLFIILVVTGIIHVIAVHMYS
jgi:hypothetical protein